MSLTGQEMASSPRMEITFHEDAEPACWNVDAIHESLEEGVTVMVYTASHPHGIDIAVIEADADTLHGTDCLEAPRDPIGWRWFSWLEVTRLHIY